VWGDGVSNYAMAVAGRNGNKCVWIQCGLSTSRKADSCPFKD
jgi:hypothetical protein